MVGAQQVKVLTMKEPPGQTFAHILGDLSQFPVSSSPASNGSEPARTGCGETSSRAAATSSTSACRSSTTCHPRHRPEEMLVDESATATVKQLGDALTEMEVNGHVFGRCSLDGRPARRRTARALDQQAAAGDEGACGPRRRVLRRDLQPPERLAEHRARQRRAQPPAARAARDATPRTELPVHASIRAHGRLAICCASAAGRRSRRHTTRRSPITCTSRTSATRSCSARREAARASS